MSQKWPSRGPKRTFLPLRGLSKEWAFHCKGGSARKNEPRFLEFSPYHVLFAAPYQIQSPPVCRHCRLSPSEYEFRPLRGAAFGPSGAAPEDSETAAPEDPETAASAAHPRYSVHPDVRRRNGGSIVHSAFDLCGCPQRSTCAPRHSAQGHEQLCRRALHSITRWHWCQRSFSE